MSSRRSRARNQRIMTVVTLVVLLAMILGTGVLVFSSSVMQSPPSNTTGQTL